MSNRPHSLRCIVPLLLTSLLFSCAETKTASPKKPSIQIFAAAGTRLVTETLCDTFEKRGLGTVARSYASSGTLARQIAAGAPADIFVSANKDWIDYLAAADLLKEGSVQPIAANALVVVAPKGRAPAVPIFEKQFDIAAAAPGRIAIGDPSYVPVGKYAKAAFENLGWFERLKPNMIMAKDVSAALSYAALGEVDWAVVYRSEATRSDRVDIIATVPSALHPPITFYIADLKSQRPESGALSTLFRSAEGTAVFRSHGFL